MATVVTRAGKGTPLSNAEMDANLTNLNDSMTYFIDSAQDWIDATVAAGAGERKALTGATYKISGNVSRDFTLRLDGQVSIIGGNATRDVDTYTGSGPAFIPNSGSDNLTFKRLSLFAFTASRLVDTTNFQLSGLFIDTGLIACPELGTINVPVVVIQDMQFGFTSQEINTGFLFNNSSIQSVSITGSAIIVDSLTTDAMIDFTGSTILGSVRIEVAMRGGSNAIGIKADAASANLSGDAQGIITNSNLKGMGTPLSGIDRSSLKWVISNARGVEPTMRDSLVTLTQPGTPVETVISSAGNIVPIEGPWVNAKSSQWSVSGGRATYIGLDTYSCPIDAKSSVRPSGGGSNRVLEMYIAIGRSGDSVATPVLATRDFATVDGGDTASLATIWQDTFNTGDFVELMGSNRNHAQNVIFDSCVLRIN